MKACSYPLLTPELCIPEVVVLSPFAMGEADTEEQGLADDFGEVEKFLLGAVLDLGERSRNNTTDLLRKVSPVSCFRFLLKK